MLRRYQTIHARPAHSGRAPGMIDSPQEAAFDVPAVSLFFSKLPRELRDECYRHAYGSDDDGVFDMISLSNYMQKERIRRKSGSLHSAPVMPRETPVCPLLNMRVNKKFFAEATEQWFRQREITCSERSDFNTICESSPIVRTCLARFSCSWDSCFFVSDKIAAICSSFAQLRRCKGLRSLTVEVQERVFENFNRLPCVDTFTAEDFKMMQEVRDLLTLPMLSSIEMMPSACSLGVTEGEKAKWVKNVAALDAYVKRELKQRKSLRGQQKTIDETNEQAQNSEDLRRRAQKQRILQWPMGMKTRPAVSAGPPSLLAPARNIPSFRAGASQGSSQPDRSISGPVSRIHPALRPSTTRPMVRVADWKVSQDKIVKRASMKREQKEQDPFMDRINDLEVAYAGVQGLFEGRTPPPVEPNGLASFYKRYPVVVVALATTTTLSIVNSIALWNVLSQR